MADIKIASMQETTSAIDSDLFIVETGADTKKIKKENLKETLGINDVYTKIEVDGFVEPITYNNAGAHNSIYRGKYLGSSVTTLQYSNIANGTFEDLYIGDYWTIGGVNYRIASFNYYINTGDTNLTTPHVVIVPDTVLYNAQMNTTNITTGGYTGSQMRTANLASAISSIKSAFSGHVVKHKQLLSNATTDGKASGWAWFDSEVDLMSEPMVYGTIVWGESTIGGSGHNIGLGKSQLPLFAHNPQSINIRENYWLRDVVSSAGFAVVGSGGSAGHGSASNSRGVRPAFSIS